MGYKYSDSGVDQDMKGAAIKALIQHLKKRKGFGKPLGDNKGFTGLIDFGDIALSLCTDGVGSKIMIAEAIDKWDTVGIDCMAMNVNDMICAGAEPLAFVDYLAVQKPDLRVASEIGKGLSKGAQESNVTIIGGETALLPDMIHGLDLAGTCLGWVKKKDIIDGTKIKPGDALVGLRSTGIHSNGYSLVRKMVSDNNLDYKKTYGKLKQSLGLELLTPTKIYVREVLKAMKRFKIKGMAHITGGGLRNIIRLNKNVCYEITDPLPVLPIFDYLQSFGIEDKEMYQTFNMGMGFLMVVDGKDGAKLAKSIPGAKVVGKVTKGKGVQFKNIHYGDY
jgi:phosphoribosylformylglycinamidine cyclo-ligase